MSNLSEWLPNYKVVYGDFTDPHPSSDSLMADLKFVPKESRNGRTYNVPVVVSLEHGQTADISGDAFAINAARNSVMKEASVDGASLLFNARIPYDAMLRSRNGTGNKRQGNAFKDAFEEKTRQLMEQGEFYGEVAAHYGPGTGATIADDIGVLAAGGTGTNLTGGVVVPVSIATWAPGIWMRMTNGLVDIYNAAGTTLVADKIAVTAVNPDYAPAGSPPGPNLTLTATTGTTTGGATAPAALAGTRMVISGWAQKGCIGVVSQFKNLGVQFGINAAAYNVWKPVQITNASGTLTRLKIQSIAARMYPQVGTAGMKMRVSGPVFADLAEETETQRQYIGDEEVRKVSATKLIYRTPCGPFEVLLDAQMKYGQAIGYGTEAKGVLVGSSPLTFRGKGDEWFFLELPSNAGSEIRCMLNWAPFFHKPNKCFSVTGLVPTALL